MERRCYGWNEGATFFGADLGNEAAIGLLTSGDPSRFEGRLYALLSAFHNRSDHRYVAALRHHGVSRLTAAAGEKPARKEKVYHFKRSLLRNTLSPCG